MNDSATKPFDVLIMGAGFVGLCQARHLMLKTPGLRVGLIDPKGTDQESRDLKVGESLVEISAMFLYRELELQEYLIENHPPKFGLNFHWPKKIDQTKSLEDYYHIWTNANPDLPSFQINRAKFEADLLQMCIDMGVEFIQGKVTDFTIHPGGELNEVEVRTRESELKLSAHHLIDAAGRKFLIGKKLDNLVTGKENLRGLDTGSAWLRVDNVDRDIFQKRRDPLNGSSSHYYGTNHFFGHGHWVWMIPIETENRTLSFGLVHHKEILEGNKVNSKEKLLAFLKANHRLTYDLIMSGEIMDFKYLPTIAHSSKKMISEDQWYTIGEAANMFDPFYSAGLVLAAYNVEAVTEVIRAKIADEPDAAWKQSEYNKFILNTSAAYNAIYQEHAQHLGDASAMSWRNYMESVFWFGILVPAFAGKWNLEKDFVKHFDRFSQQFILGKDSFIKEFYAELTAIQKSGRNVGMMNYTRTDQIPFGYNPIKIWDDFQENSKHERRRLNVLKGIKHSFFFLLMLYIKVRVTNSGFLGLLAPRSIKRIGSLLGWLAFSIIGELFHKLEVRGMPPHSQYGMQEKEFMSYQYEAKIIEPELDSDSKMMDADMDQESEITKPEAEVTTV